MTITRREKMMVLAAVGAAVAVILAGPPASRLARHLIWPVTPYRAVFNSSVSGLEPGDEVEVRGVVVGRVVKVGITDDSPPRIEVNFEVDSKTPIRRDAVAALDTSAKDGSRIIKIEGGTAAAGPMPPGQQIATEDVGEAELQTEDLSRKASDILASLSGKAPKNGEKKSTSKQLAKMLDDADAVLKNLRVLTANLAQPGRIETIDSTLDNLHDASAHLAHASGVADTALGDFAETVKTFALHRRELYSDVSTALNRLNQALGTAQKTFETAQQTLSSADRLIASADFLIDNNSAEVERTLHQVARATVRLNETLDAVQNDPSLLIWRGRVSTKAAQ
jgi:phospholipid/cholesterol/gamma-HCH transport system substrate-binding protein